MALVSANYGSDSDEDQPPSTSVARPAGFASLPPPQASNRGLAAAPLKPSAPSISLGFNALPAPERPQLVLKARVMDDAKDKPKKKKRKRDTSGDPTPVDGASKRSTPSATSGAPAASSTLPWLPPPSSAAAAPSALSWLPPPKSSTSSPSGVQADSAPKAVHDQDVTITDASPSDEDVDEMTVQPPRAAAAAASSFSVPSRPVGAGAAAAAVPAQSAPKRVEETTILIDDAHDYKAPPLAIPMPPGMRRRVPPVGAAATASAQPAGASAHAAQTLGQSAHSASAMDLNTPVPTYMLPQEAGPSLPPAGAYDYAAYDQYADQYGAGYYDGADAAESEAVNPAISQVLGNVSFARHLRGNLSQVKIVDVNQADLTKKSLKEQLEAQLRDAIPSDKPKIMSAFYNAQGGAIAISDQPTKVHKRKHQINSLAYAAQANRAQIELSRSKGQRTRQQSMARYGWA